MTITPTELDIRPVGGNLGAEISGVSLSGDLSGETIARIREAALAYKVVFFRGQHLDDAEHLAFAERLGTVTRSNVMAGPNAKVCDLNYSSNVTGSNVWHTDATFIHQPPSFSILRAITIPPAGGDTQWANTVTAYAGLPQELRELADKLWVLHSNYIEPNEYTERVQNQSLAAKVLKHVGQASFKTIHPLVSKHPETGERSLRLGMFARGIVGFEAPASTAFCKLLQDEITKPENTVRWNWHVGDLAIWDNRSTQHYAIADYGSQPRRMKRITIVGQIPVSINGEPSRCIEGDCSGFNQQTPSPSPA